MSIGLTKITGIPVMPQVGGGLAFTQGKVIHVKPGSGSDSNSGLHPDKPIKTLARALVLATANQNDIVLLYAESNTASATTDYQSVALDWNKDGVHLIGVGSMPFLGQRARIAQTSTVLTIEDLFTVSADNCLIKNIEVFHGVASSTATSPRAMVVSGQRNRIENCQISGLGDTSLDTAGARSLSVTGSENYFKECYIGLDTVIRATNVIEVDVTSCARTIFEDCIFNVYTSSTTGKIVHCATIDRFVIFKNCMFCAVQGITSAAVPTGAISTATLNGQVWLLGCGVFGPADFSTADNTAMLNLSYTATTVVDMGVAKGVDVA